MRVAFRRAQPEDCALILAFIKGLAEYEKMADQVVADESTLSAELFEQRRARILRFYLRCYYDIEDSCNDQTEEASYDVGYSLYVELKNAGTITINELRLTPSTEPTESTVSSTTTTTTSKTTKTTTTTKASSVGCSTV